MQGALLARGGASVDSRVVHGPVGFTVVLGASWPGGEDGKPSSIEALAHPRTAPAIERNWIKLHPSCLGTHSPIDAAEQLRGRVNGGPIKVFVHPVARQAAHLDAVSDGLSAKFSIPYCVAHTLTHGAPRTADFVLLDQGVVERAAAVSVTLDDSLPMGDGARAGRRRYGPRRRATRRSRATDHRGRAGREGVGPGWRAA